MGNYATLTDKIADRVAQKKRVAVFVREDFQDLGGYDKVGRVRRKIGYGGAVVYFESAI